MRENAGNALSPDALHGSDHMKREARAPAESRRVRTATCTASVTAATHCRLDAFLRQQTVLWNASLEERIDCYRKTGKTITAFDQMKSLTVIRGEDKDFRQFHVSAQRSVLRRVDRAFQAFFRRAKKEGKCPSETDHRQVNCLNDVVEADHGKLKRLIKPTLGFKSMKTAYATIKGFEAMRALRKKQASAFQLQPGIRGEVRLVERAFGIGPEMMSELMSLHGAEHEQIAIQQGF